MDSTQTKFKIKLFKIQMFRNGKNHGIHPSQLYCFQDEETLALEVYSMSCGF